MKIQKSVKKSHYHQLPWKYKKNDCTCGLLYFCEIFEAAFKRILEDFYGEILSAKKKNEERKKQP